jgi:hypothetical protein
MKVCFEYRLRLNARRVKPIPASVGQVVSKVVKQSQYGDPRKGSHA